MLEGAGFVESSRRVLVDPASSRIAVSRTLLSRALRESTTKAITPRVSFPPAQKILDGRAARALFTCSLSRSKSAHERVRFAQLRATAHDRVHPPLTTARRIEAA